MVWQPLFLHGQENLKASVLGLDWMIFRTPPKNAGMFLFSRKKNINPASLIKNYASHENFNDFLTTDHYKFMKETVTSMKTLMETKSLAGKITKDGRKRRIFQN